MVLLRQLLLKLVALPFGGQLDELSLLRLLVELALDLRVALLSLGELCFELLGLAQ